MKYLLFSTIVLLLTLVLASCANIPANVQENAPAVPPESMQDSTSTEAVSENTVEVVGGDEEALREFIRQWVVPVYPVGTSQDVTVYIGSIPNDIPYDLPTPKDSRIIGSVTGNWVDYLLIYESSLTSESIQEFYAEALKDKGWKEAPSMPGGGFTSSTDLFKGYCYGENEAFLNLETPSTLAEKTSIRLSLDVSPDSYMCDANRNPGADNANLIPALHAPRGITIQGSGAGSSDRDANVSANLTGDLTAAEVADFYNEQLTAAGWELRSENQGEGAAWSHWTFQDEQGADWSGALMVIELSTTNDRLFALVTVEKNK